MDCWNGQRGPAGWWQGCRQKSDGRSGGEFEGPVFIRNATTTSNTFVDEGQHGPALKTDDVPCQAGATGGSWSSTHPPPVCGADSCTAPSKVFTAECDDTECSAQLQSAFDSCCAWIKIPARADGSPWVTAHTLLLRSNSTVEFQPGVTILAKRGEFKTKGAPLFLARNISGMTIIGYGAVFKMWKLDYDKPSLGYCHSEGRPGLWMGSNCNNCSVFGLTVTIAMGDKVIFMPPVCFVLIISLIVISTDEKYKGHENDLTAHRSR